MAFTVLGRRESGVFPDEAIEIAGRTDADARPNSFDLPIGVCQQLGGPVEAEPHDLVMQRATQGGPESIVHGNAAHADVRGNRLCRDQAGKMIPHVRQSRGDNRIRDGCGGSG